MKKSPKSEAIPCTLNKEVKTRIEVYAEALKASAFDIGNHGLSRVEFEASGLFGAAVERIGSVNLIV